MSFVRVSELGQDSGHGGAGHAHLQHQDEEQVQRDVKKAGEDKKIQRPGGVAHGAENAASHVVDEKTRDPTQVDAQIDRGLRHHVLRRAHEVQQGPHQGYAQQGEEQAQYKSGGHGGLDGAVELVHVPGAEVLADDNARADGEAVEEKDHHIDDHGGGADGRQGLLADEVADDDGVHRVIEHLKHIAQHQRQGEKDHLPEDGALGHIPGGAVGVKFHDR